MIRLSIPASLSWCISTFIAWPREFSRLIPLLALSNFPLCVRRCKHPMLCRKLKNSLSSPRLLICPSFCQSVTLTSSPSSNPWTGGNLLFPARNSTGDRFQQCALNYWWSVPVLLSPLPRGFLLRDTERKQKSLRTLSASQHKTVWLQVCRQAHLALK